MNQIGFHLRFSGLKPTISGFRPQKAPNTIPVYRQKIVLHRPNYRVAPYLSSAVLNYCKRIFLNNTTCKTIVIWCPSLLNAYENAPSLQTVARTLKIRGTVCDWGGGFNGIRYWPVERIFWSVVFFRKNGGYIGEMWPGIRTPLGLCPCVCGNSSKGLLSMETQTHPLYRQYPFSLHPWKSVNTSRAPTPENASNYCGNIVSVVVCFDMQYYRKRSIIICTRTLQSELQ